MNLRYTAVLFSSVETDQMAKRRVCVDENWQRFCPASSKLQSQKGPFKLCLSERGSLAIEVLILKGDTCIADQHGYECDIQKHLATDSVGGLNPLNAANLSNGK